MFLLYPTNACAALQLPKLEPDLSIFTEYLADNFMEIHRNFGGLFHAARLSARSRPLEVDLCQSFLIPNEV